MSRMDLGPRMTVKPMPNVYTGLAAIAALSTLGALIYVILQYKTIIGF